MAVRLITRGAPSTTSSSISGTRLKRKICLVPEWKSGVVETMIAPSRNSATRFSIVCETRVPSSTGKVSRILPVRRASVSARAGSPRRAGRVADISTPIIVAEVTSRRRTGRLGSAARAIQYQEAARKKSELAISAAGDEDQRQVRADDAFDDLVDADLLRREQGQTDTEDAGDAEADAAGDAAAALAVAGQRRVERGKLLGRLAGAAVGRAQARPVGDTLAGADRARRRHRPLVDLGHLVGDAGPGVALGALAGGRAHRLQPLRLEVGPLQLLGQALRVARAGRGRRRRRR